MSEIIRVGIADLKICKAPDLITTIGLGSCVGIVLYEPNLKISGLVHIMLPDSTKIKQNNNKMKFADSGIKLLISQLKQEGCEISNLKAKIAGGAKMFNFSSVSEISSIGQKNIDATKEVLKKYKIEIISEDIGENYGRTILFNPSNYEFSVIRAGNERKII